MNNFGNTDYFIEVSKNNYKQLKSKYAINYKKSALEL